MVESVGSKGMGDVQLTPVTRVAAPAPAQPVTVAVPAANASTAQALATTPPVDTDRVQRIKAAVQSGTFPISPATIADRLIALKYEWMSHDQA